MTIFSRGNSHPECVRLCSIVAVLLAAAALMSATAAEAQTSPVRITLKPQGIVHGTLPVPVTVSPNVARIDLYVNTVKHSSATGRSVVMPVLIGDYLRRLRIRVVGVDAQNTPVGEDEMVVNDPQPPFRVRIYGPSSLPPSGQVTLGAAVIKPDDLDLVSVDFFLGEQWIATTTTAPYTAMFEIPAAGKPLYTRVAAHARDGQEANDVLFFGSQPRDQVDVTMQQIPLSVASGPAPALADLTLIDDGRPRKIEGLVPASDQPLTLILLIDASESMLEELPVVKEAAKQFAQRLLRPSDRIAVVAFNQRTYWLTDYTHDFNRVAEAVDHIQPRGETHLYDTAIEMLFELQKAPGRHALVILTDGVDQGSSFKLAHLAWYARYAGVPIYPIIKNRMLSRLMRLGVGQFEARRLSTVARDTGATYFIIQRESELPGVYARIAEELRQQYLLLFYSDPSAPDQWHSLAIEDGKSALRIPRGYFP